MALRVVKTNGGSVAPSSVEKRVNSVSKDVATPHTLPLETEAVFEGFPAAEEIAEALSGAIQAKNARDIPDSLSPQRIQNYLNVLLYCRIQQVRGIRVRQNGGIFQPQNFMYPAILWPVIRAVGDVEDHVGNLVIRVQLGNELAIWDNADQDAWDEIEETYRDILSWGGACDLELADALPRDTDGSLRVLSLFVGDRGFVSSPRLEDSPVDIMVRSLLEINLVENIFGAPRVEYQSVRFYQRQFISLLRMSLVA